MVEKEKEKNSPRTLDIDIICFDDLIINDDNLNIPHPNLHKRPFVFLPLRDLNKSWKHPVFLKTIDEFVKEFDPNELKSVKNFINCYNFIMSDELQLIKKIKSYNNYVDENVIINAYKYASELHKTQKRHSGDPYISHPVAVANILAELKLDGPTITTALLHDTIEDTKATYDEVKNNFGEEIADLVDGVTKISKLEVEKKTLTAGENFRKLILATSKDIRVLLVKLADRLHNIRTITSIDKKEKRERIAKETMEIYAPLAERMGMHKVRDELEDRSFAILNDEARSLIVNRVKEISPGRKKYLKRFQKKLNKF